MEFCFLTIDIDNDKQLKNNYINGRSHTTIMQHGLIKEMFKKKEVYNGFHMGVSVGNT